MSPTFYCLLLDPTFWMSAVLLVMLIRVEVARLYPHLVDLRDDNPYFEVLPSEGKGRGLFLRKGLTRLTRGMEIPITGEKLTQSQYDFLEEKTHVWMMWERVNGKMKKYYIDGRPTAHSWNLASMINEPGPGQKPNCYQQGNKIIVDYNLKEGQELLVSYGPEYVRDYIATYTNRKHQGDHQKKLFRDKR
jgi:hypothetical protein